MIVDELERHEAPKFMVEEAALIRYLIETHCLRARYQNQLSLVLLQVKVVP